MKTKLPKAQKLPSGSWRVQVKAAGRRISVVDEDPGVAQAKAMAIREGLIEERARPKAVTLDQAIREYIAARGNTLSPSTIRGYETVRRNRFADLMQRDIHTITRRDVQTAVNREALKVSPKTVANAYGVIRPVLAAYGVDAAGVSLPKKSKPQKKYIQLEEIGKLLEEARGDDCEIGILLAVWLGLRRSEILGLCWDCVDEDKGTVTVRRTLVPDSANKYVLREMTKNQSSNRVVRCPPYIMDRLAAQRKGRTSGRVFPWHPDTLRKHIHRVCAAAGITDTTTHGLRHTNAAVMRSLGVSTQHAMERGGWTEEKTYKGLYSYAFESVSTAEDEMIDGFFSGQLDKKAHERAHEDPEPAGKSSG